MSSTQFPPTDLPNNIRSLTALIKSRIGIGYDRQPWHTPQYVFLQLNRKETRLPEEVKEAARGIRWAMETGRIPGEHHCAIRMMGAKELCKLVAQVYKHTPVSEGIPGEGADIPQWLINHPEKLGM